MRDEGVTKRRIIIIIKILITKIMTFGIIAILGKIVLQADVTLMSLGIARGPISRETITLGMTFQGTMTGGKSTADMEKEEYRPQTKMC
jgi:hypothetical protein